MPKMKLKIAHLYGDLMNTYGDYGNVLVWQYYGRQMGVQIDSQVVSIDQKFKAQDYDLALLGDGQYFEQSIVAADLPQKRSELLKFIQTGKPLLAIGQGFQLLGRYFVTPAGHKVKGLGMMNHYTIQQRHPDLVGKLVIKNPLNHQKYHGFEHHQDQTFLGDKEQPLGQVITGSTVGNNLQDQTEGAQYKNVYGTYLHSFLARNHQVAKVTLKEALRIKKGE